MTDLQTIRDALAAATPSGQPVEELSRARDAVEYAAPTWLAELVERVERAEAALEEQEGDMHLRIRRGYDQTVADSWRAEVAKVEARAEAAEREATLRIEMETQAAKERDQAQAEVERLRAALRKYGEHDSPCPAGSRVRVDAGSLGERDERERFPCTCGLDAALAAAGGERP